MAIRSQADRQLDSGSHIENAVDCAVFRPFGEQRSDFSKDWIDSEVTVFIKFYFLIFKRKFFSVWIKFGIVSLLENGVKTKMLLRYLAQKGVLKVCRLTYCFGY